MGSRAYDSWIDCQFSCSLWDGETATEFSFRIVVVLVAVVAVFVVVLLFSLWCANFMKNSDYAAFEHRKKKKIRNFSANNISYTSVMPLICDDLDLLTFPLKLRESTDWYACKWQFAFIFVLVCARQATDQKGYCAQCERMCLCARISLWCGMWMDTSTY